MVGLQFRNQFFAPIQGVSVERYDGAVRNAIKE